jgi:hypothetical protein
MSINHMTYAALNEIAQERARQIEVEGFDAEHDDLYVDRSLALAGAAYADAASWAKDKRMVRMAMSEGDAPPSWWPWAKSWWKPTTRRRDLIKAGALIIAEIERLDRISALGGDPEA